MAGKPAQQQDGGGCRVNKPAGPSRKHIPLRTCIACRRQRPKRELIRIVRTPTGSLEVDLKGKQAGRGAYLCPDRRCWEILSEPRKLGRALKCEVSAEEAARLRAVAAPLLTEEGGPDGNRPVDGREG